MFRTIKLKLPYDRSVIETARQFREASQIVLNYGFENKVFNENKLNKGTYKMAGEQYPHCPLHLCRLRGIQHQKH